MIPKRFSSLRVVLACALALFLAIGGQSFAQMNGAEAPQENHAPAAGSAPAKAVTANPDGELPAEGAITPADQVERWKLTLDQMELSIDREGLSEDDLTEIEREIAPMRSEATELATRLAPELKALQDQLKQLAPSEENGQANEQLAARSADVQEAFAALESVVKLARQAVVRIDRIQAKSAERRRDRFNSQLAAKYHSLLTPTVWRDALADVPRIMRSTSILFTDAVAAMGNRLAEKGYALPALTVLATIAAVFGISRFARGFLRRRNRNEEPSRLDQLSAAAWRTIVFGVVPGVALYLLYWSLHAQSIFPPKMEDLVHAIVMALAIFNFTTALARAILAPYAPRWRLVGLDQAVVRPVRLAAGTAAGLVGLNIVLGELFDVTAASLPAEVLKSGILSLLIAGTFATALIRIARKSNTDEEPETLTSGERYWRWLRIVLWIGIVASVAGALIGYVAAAAFISAQMVFASIILTVLALLIGLNDQMTETYIGDGEGMDAAIARSIGMSNASMEQFGVLLSGLLRFALIVLAGIMIMLPWGFDTRQWQAWLQKAFFGFQVGELTISLSTVFSALALFLVGVIATRALQRWMGERYLPHTRLDIGVRNSIRTTLGYVGIGAAAALAITYVGLDLANLALVAGALSLGIGFGLQSIVNNFVSGLILLAERPIKEGDWIVAGEAEGNVRRISIRATEIETFDRATVIVPNSDLISGTVKNMMLNNRMGRIVIPVGVSYDSDPDQVRELMLAAAHEHDNVLSDPAPRVQFIGFGDSALDFSLYAYLRDVDSSLTTRSDLNFAILRAFRQAEIEIPFPQRDINIRDIDRIEKALTTKPTTSRTRTRK